jgi:hypothetical protein
MPKKKPPTTNAHFGAARGVEYDYDGITIADALDYYFPEWRHKTGKILEFASGWTDDGMQFVLSILVARNGISRVEVDIRTEFSDVKIFPTGDPKTNLLGIIRKGDKYDKGTDKRFLMMMEDLTKKDMSN